jgi:hypothetical protein
MICTVLEAAKGKPYQPASCEPRSALADGNSLSLNSGIHHHSNHAIGEAGQYSSLHSASSLVADNGETPWSTG